jgi:hypothetical protein
MHSLLNIIRMIKSRRRWEGHAARMGEMRMHSTLWSEKPEGKGQLGRHKSRLEENISIDLKEI